MNRHKSWLTTTAILTGILAINTVTAVAQPVTLSRTFDNPTPTAPGPSSGLGDYF